MTAPKVTFGLYAGHCADYATTRRFALMGEQLGYRAVWLCDHLLADLYHSGDVLTRTAPILEAWTVLSALGAETDRVRLGIMVTDNMLRHPPLLAKMAATVDVITDGRLEFGIGAGWYEAEHLTYGYDFPPVGERLGRMREAVEICKKMWTEPAASYEGKYYRIAEAVCEPKPVQKPHPPVLIAGAGEQVTLRIVARLADKWNCASFPVGATKAKIEILDKYCLATGRDPSTVEKTWHGSVILDPHIDESAALQARAANFGIAVEKLTSRMIAGSPEQCIEKIQRYIAVGITHFALSFENIHDLEGPKEFVEKVIARVI